MRYRTRTLFAVLVVIQAVICCQPPVPLFQTAPVVPPSPAFAPGLVSGVQSHRPSQTNQPVSISSSIDQELTPFGSADSPSPNAEGITPYPGYIPPPVEFPTLIQQEPSSLTRINDNSLQQLEDELYQKGPAPPASNGCPNQLTSLTEVMNCMQLLPPTKLEENALSCDFEQDSACRFQPTSPAFDTARFSSSNQYSSFARIAGRNEVDSPNGAFLALIQRKVLPPEEEAVLSTPITCQKGNANLTFNYWFVGNSYAKLQVCTQDYTLRSCTKSILYLGSSLVTVEVVHPNTTVFDVEIVISNLIGPTVFAIDNIKYEAEMCETRRQPEIERTDFPEDVVDSFFQEEEDPVSIEIENEPELLVGIPTRPTDEAVLHTFDGGLIGPPGQLVESEDEKPKDGPPSVTPFDFPENSTLEIKKISSCTLLNCAFNGGFCEYSNYRNESFRTAEWNLGSSKIGNPHTGIRKEDTNEAGGFLYVGTDSSDHSVTTYILESTKLSLERDIILSVDIYRRSNDITLQICLNTPFYCPYTVSPFVKGHFWKEGERFSIAKETKKIFFKAIQWRKFKWLAIDNIQVVDEPCS